MFHWNYSSSPSRASGFRHLNTSTGGDKNILQSEYTDENIMRKYCLHESGQGFAWNCVLIEIWLPSILVPNAPRRRTSPAKQPRRVRERFRPEKMTLRALVSAIRGAYPRVIIIFIVSGRAESQAAGAMVTGAQSVALQNVADVCLTSIPCNPRARYRSFDGSCNNLQQPGWGSVNTALVRLLPAAYQDGE